MDTTVTARVLTQRQLRPWWLAGALLMMLDGLSTWWALTAYPGKVHEGNPVGIWAFEHLGVGTACILKSIIGVTMVWRLAAVAERGHRWEWMNRSVFLTKTSTGRVKRNARRVLIGSTILMALVVLNNFTIIVMHGVG